MKSFFISIDGIPHSNYRSPKGVYKIGVTEEKTLKHTAYAAIQVARESVPFLNENSHSFTLRAYLEDGREIVVPRPLATNHEENGRFFGRSTEYPESIELQ